MQAIQNNYSLQGIGKQFNEVVATVGSANFYWQLIILFACLALGWLSAKLLNRFAGNPKLIESPDNDVTMVAGVNYLSSRSFRRVIWPFVSFVLLLFSVLVCKFIMPTSLLKVAIPLLGSFALIRFSVYLVRKIFVKPGTVGNPLQVFERVLASLIWIALVMYYLGWWENIFLVLEEVHFTLGKTKFSLFVLLQGLVTVVVTILIALWMSAVFEARLLELSHVNTSLKVVLARLARAILMVLAILISLAMVGIDITVLSVFGGALGVGLGLGLQKIASSYVSGFIILFDRSISIDDMITVDKYTGCVTQINTRYTVLKGLDGVESIVPNEMLVSNPVQNFSLTDKEVVIHTEFTVAYHTDIDSLLQKLIETTKGVERVVQEPAPNSYLMKFGADGFDVRVSFWIDDPENGKSNIISEVNKAIWKLLKQENIALPYAQREIRILNDKHM